MCGITCLVDPQQRYSADVFAEWTHLLSHRGPDASGIFSEKAIRLGHRRLSVLDLSSAANQPFICRCGRYVTVFNGEIYNFRDLAQTWGLQPRTNSDTEILIEGFCKFGTDVLRSLRGMFAFCIYDRKTQEVYVARDHLGVKPLYYHQSAQLFAAASELKVLSQLREVRAAGTDPRAVSRYLSSGYVPSPLTIYRNVAKLPPGHWGMWRGGQLRIQPFWSLPENIEEDTVTDEGEALERLSAAVKASVKEQLVSDVPFGSFLSGGVDSSLVTAVAQELSDRPLLTFCVRMEGWAKDESEFAARVAKLLGTRHQEFSFSQAEAQNLLPEITSVYDEPYADSSAAPTMLLSRLARRHVTVALCGDGGDELFLGYGTYLWSRRLASPWLQGVRRLLSWFCGKLGDRAQRLGEILEPCPPKHQVQQTFSAEQGFFTEAARRAILREELARELDLDFQVNCRRQLNPMERQSLFDLTYYLPDDLLTKVDRATMSYGLEARVPLLGIPVVELALNLDSRLKLAGRTQKYLLKKLLRRYLPDELIDRPKWGFSIPLKQWMLGPLRWLEEEYLSPRIIQSGGIVRNEAVRDLRMRFHQGEERLFTKLWTLIVLHKWLLENGMA